MNNRRSLPLPTTEAEATLMLSTTYTRAKFNRLDDRLTKAGWAWGDFDRNNYFTVLNHYNNAIR